MVSDDRAQIQTVLAQYALIQELESVQACPQLFTPDALFEVGGVTHRGRTDIAVFLGRAPQGVHHIGLPVIEIDGDRATASMNFIFVVEGTFEVRCGWYQDDLDRVDGRWLISRRRAARLMPTG
jgi:limonene-1,2-epoxide hydrolase